MLRGEALCGSACQDSTPEAPDPLVPTSEQDELYPQAARLGALHIQAVLLMLLFTALLYSPGEA